MQHSHNISKSQIFETAFDWLYGLDEKKKDQVHWRKWRKNGEKIQKSLTK
jgi:hypothetical protein